MNYPAAACTTLGILLAVSAASAQPARTAPSGAPAPIPRTIFIQTMDSEFRKLDSDKNNIVTKVEIEQSQRAAGSAMVQARLRSTFAQLDADKNGQLSLAEFARLAAAPPPPNAAPVLGQADLNRNGSITLVEYRTAKLANFDRMDADKDGVVSAIEMKAAGLVK